MEPKDEYTRKATAHLRQPSAGSMQDRRTKRARTRKARDLRAIREDRS
jgi:hypothetical protein